ncbi:MAG: hypothetical protein JSU71_03385 [Betaproteobacteria bacterium]|nr:MAG: hypothetical protein AMJ67_03460 [Betaproteobacteria bacterium SG8_41]UCF76352.1 MAG: hypothetical protein JSU71_03385 [Betaproteobacteria bacterium]
MHDTIEFEKRGIPATVFLTQVFKNAAVYQFRTKGMDGHPFVELPHPVSNLTPDEMRTLTERYVGDMVRQLTRSRES